MKRFALIGAAGYIAPRHMKAISETGNSIVAAVDRSDSVGIIDSYFPDADFFTEFERFDRHIEKLRRRKGYGIDYVSICSPNYLHDAHIRFALRVGADAVCEKPLVLNPWNVEALASIESETGRSVHNILQLRLHPAIVELKQQVQSSSRAGKYDIDLTYITPRGRWYLFSWKADASKSGGIATNIGIHFFDMLIWVFGAVQDIRVHVSEPRRAAGFLELEKARVRWFLSIDGGDLPVPLDSREAKSYRSLKIEEQQISFSNGFKDLHTQSYAHILNGRGFGLAAARASIEAAYSIRTAEAVGLKGDYHPLLERSKVCC
ncbi:MAG: Gfo/Idh/MocA family oxidoreductase [Planctomycetes bacterium]|nr:Gfo/Idh/MocA family oxidoreductase [Planctomycetota bacterium]MBL7152248.1 Gfo/Idh/MocA family oxidoreductase [Phycisphaerae bacterium]